MEKFAVYWNVITFRRRRNEEEWNGKENMYKTKAILIKIGETFSKKKEPAITATAI